MVDLDRVHFGKGVQTSVNSYCVQQKGSHIDRCAALRAAVKSVSRRIIRACNSVVSAFAPLALRCTASKFAVASVARASVCCWPHMHDIDS